MVGYLAYRSGFMARIFGILLIVAGLGYLADGFATILVPDFPFSFALFVFSGEVALIFWLLIRATGSASRSFQRTAEDSAELYDRSVSASASSGTVETTEYRLDTPGCKPGGQGPRHGRNT